MQQRKRKIFPEQKPVPAAVPVIIGLLTAGLLALTAACVVLNSAASGTLAASMPFSLSQLNSEETGTQTKGPGAYVLPSFFGVLKEDGYTGLSAGEDMLAEMYTLIAPCLADVFAGEGNAVTEEEFREKSAQTGGVYMKFAGELPVSVLQAAAAEVCGAPEEAVSPLYARELFLWLEDTALAADACLAVIRDSAGRCYRFAAKESGKGGAYPTMETICTLAADFPNHFSGFRFAGDAYAGLSYTEPVFTERVRVRGVRLSRGMAMMIENRPEHLRTLLRLFDFNPDKLSAHTENTEGVVAVEAHGVFRRDTDFYAYTASADGGVPLSHLLPYRESYGLTDELRYACTVIDTLRSMRTYYLGGDASVRLTEVEETAHGTTRLVFSYTFDNLLLRECADAAVFTFRNGRLLSAELFAAGVSDSGEMDSAYLEEGILWHSDMGQTVCLDLCLTYRAVFDSAVQYPVWTWLTLTESEDGDRGEEAAAYAES